MRVGLLAAHAANPALVAVVLSLVDVVEQDALCAPIGTESHATRDTGRAGLLLRVAPHTLDDLYGFPVQLVGLLRVGVSFVFRGVVAETAGEELAAARSQQGRLAFVVVAAFVGWGCKRLHLYRKTMRRRFRLGTFRTPLSINLRPLPKGGSVNFTTASLSRIN